MKKLTLIVIAIFGIAITSCSKYEDGPAFSLLTKKARLCGDWTLESYTADGVDYTSQMQTTLGSDFVWKIEKDETYSTSGNFADHGTWELGEDKDDVRFRPDTGQTISYRILRLKSKELWLRYTENNGTYDIYKLKQ